MCENSEISIFLENEVDALFASHQLWLGKFHMVMGQNPVPLVNIKIAGKWMFIHPNRVP